MGKIHDKPWFKYSELPSGGDRAVILGAGIAGCATGYFLSQNGWDVTIIDRLGGICRAASGNPASVFYPLLTDKHDSLGCWFYDSYRFLLSQLNPEVVYSKCGLLELREKKVKKNLRNTVLEKGHVIRMSPDEINNLWGLKHDKDALLLPHSGWLKLDSLAGYYSKNLEVITCCEVESIGFAGGRWSVFNEGRAVASAPVLILANSYDTKKFVPELSLTQVRGQLTYIDEIREKVDVVMCGDSYITPNIDGRHIVGATFQRGDIDTSLRYEDHLANIGGLPKFLTPRKQEKYQGRVAFRAATYDRRAIVGAVADFDFFNNVYSDICDGKYKKNYPLARYKKGLYVNTAHGSRGCVSAPAAAKFLADLICGEKGEFAKYSELLHPARFAIRNLSRQQG